MSIYPSLLTDSPEFFESELLRFSQLTPRPQVVQIDIIDGEFADEVTVEAGHFTSVPSADFLYDIHLMTVEPTHFLEEFWGAQNVRTVIAQIERMSDVDGFQAAVAEAGWAVGLSLDIFTPVTALEELNLSQVAVVQLMGNRAGQQGQELHPITVTKVEELAKLRSDLGLSFEIIIDIGVNNETIEMLKQAGADGFVVGSYLQGDDAQSHWEALNRAKGQ